MVSIDDRNRGVRNDVWAIACVDEVSEAGGGNSEDEGQEQRYHHLVSRRTDALAIRGIAGDVIYARLGTVCHAPHTIRLGSHYVISEYVEDKAQYLVRLSRGASSFPDLPSSFSSEENAAQPLRQHVLLEVDAALIGGRGGRRWTRLALYGVEKPSSKRGLSWEL